MEEVKGTTHDVRTRERLNVADLLQVINGLPLEAQTVLRRGAQTCRDRHGGGTDVEFTVGADTYLANVRDVIFVVNEWRRTHGWDRTPPSREG